MKLKLEPFPDLLEPNFQLKEAEKDGARVFFLENDQFISKLCNFQNFSVSKVQTVLDLFFRQEEIEEGSLHPYYEYLS